MELLETMKEIAETSKICLKHIPSSLLFFAKNETTFIEDEVAWTVATMEWKERKGCRAFVVLIGFPRFKTLFQ